MHRLLHGYVTFRDLYLASSSIEVVDRMMEQAHRSLNLDYVLVAKEAYLKLPKNVKVPFEDQHFGFVFAVIISVLFAGTVAWVFNKQRWF